MSSHRIFLLALILSVAPWGCASDHIAVTIEPQPDGSISRTIRLSRTDGHGGEEAPSDLVVKAAEAHYKKRLKQPDKAVAFQGTFRSVPGDIAFGGDTNHGALTEWTSSLGKVSYYRERRPGRIDHYTLFTEMSVLMDQVTSVAATVARDQLKGEKGLDPLVQFLEGPVRKDLKELLFYVFEQEAAKPAETGGKEDEGRQMGVFAFMLNYAEERGYLSIDDFPKLDDPAQAFEWYATLIAKKMGRPLDDALRKKLSFLKDPARLDPAVEKALKANSLKPDELSNRLQPIGESIFPIFVSNTSVDYSLRLSEHGELIYTNGTVEDRTVQWDTKLHILPVTEILYALWATPDVAGQKKRLGRVLLTGEKLSEYAVWENALDPAMRKKWNAALDGLDPKGDLGAQISVLAGEDEDEMFAKGVRKLLDALRKSESKDTEPPREDEKPPHK